MNMLALLLCAITLSMQVFAGDDKFSISVADQRNHLYAIIENRFDSTALHFTVGEFRIKRSTLRLPVHYATTSLDRQFEWGTSTTGLDSVLTNKFKSLQFMVSSGDSVEFYRSVVVSSIHCDDPTRPGDPAPPDGMGNYPDTWKAAYGDIVDTSTVMLRIERVSDTAVYATLDSVVVSPNTNSKYVPHGGTNPDAYIHTRAIPAAFDGQMCRLRIAVRRMGASPLGMMGQFHREKMALSVWSDRAVRSKIDAATVDSLDSRYLELAEAYVDSLMSTSNSWESIMHLKIPDATFRRIVSKHFSITEHEEGAFSYTPLNKFLDTAGLYLHTTATEKADYASFDEMAKPGVHAVSYASTEASALSIRYVRLRSGMLEVNCTKPVDTKELKWRIVDITGRILQEGYAWPDFTAQGSLQLPFPWQVPGPYILQLVDVLHSSAASAKMLNR